MCFASKSSTVTPKPTAATRFEYNRPVPDPNATQAKQAAQGTASTTGTFGAELGATPPPSNAGAY